MTQQELLSLFNIATSVRPQDKFLLHTANGQAVEVTAELVRAYLIKGLVEITLDEQGYIYINGEKTDFKVEGGTAIIDVDDALSDTSENPVQNKVIKSEIDRLDAQMQAVPIYSFDVDMDDGCVYCEGHELSAYSFIIDDDGNLVMLT